MVDLSNLLADLTSGDDRLAEKSVEGLIALGKEGVPDLLNLRDASDEDARWWAYCTLGQMPEADIDWFLPGLQDESSGVRESAAMALCLNPHPSAISRLITALSDSDRMVATLAGNALIEIGQAATPGLVNTLENSTPIVKIEAARVLSEIRDTRAIPAFMKGLGDSSEMVNFWSERGLENLGVGMVYFAPE
jgi:HEAT repeat protein